jgi:hypothetical protein
MVDNSAAEAPGPSEVASKVASIVADLTDVWAAQARRWYERRDASEESWVPEDAVSETIDLVEHLTPVLERSIDLTIELLRPWAVALQERQSDGG